VPTSGVVAVLGVKTGRVVVVVLVLVLVVLLVLVVPGITEGEFDVGLKATGR
jgi:competence protein ComGC